MKRSFCDPFGIHSFMGLCCRCPIHAFKREFMNDDGKLVGFPLKSRSACPSHISFSCAISADALFCFSSRTHRLLLFLTSHNKISVRWCATEHDYTEAVFEYFWRNSALFFLTRLRFFFNVSKAVTQQKTRSFYSLIKIWWTFKPLQMSTSIM